MVETRVDIPSGEITLAGVLHLPDAAGPSPVVVVCHPHPQYGGDMHNNVVMAIVRAAVGRGLAALRFNFRGVGGSGGAYDGGRGEQDDVRAALAYVATRPEVTAIRLGLAGYSFGAAMAARVAGDEVGALLLVAPPTRMGGDLGGTLAGFPRPLLLVAGDEDHVCPAAGLRTLAATLGERAHVHIVEGTDHFWQGYERELERITGDFLHQTL